MTRGRCQRRRKMMGRSADGGCGTEEKHCPISSSSSSRVPTKLSSLAGGGIEGIDFYAQACKALALLSPFDLEDGQKKSSTVVPTLPAALANNLSKHSDSRKRHKKSHLGSDTKKNKSSSRQEKPRGPNVWSETEDCFRELRMDDIEKLNELSSFRASKYISIPCSGNNLKEENNHRHSGGIVANEDLEEEEDATDHFMEVDGVDASEISQHHVEEEDKSVSLHCSGVEWLLGSRSKIYLTSERPSKKRKLFGGQTGLEKLFVARPVNQEGPSSCCHYCSLGDTGNQLNRLIVCTSCGVAVHQRCYGVQQDDETGSWLCSWCRLRRDGNKGTDSHCLLCPQQGGALKPVRKGGIVNDDGGLTEFAHLFCCQWMPEVYIEDIKSMEPIMNIEGIKETQKKLVCYICKVKCGACVRCSNGACRTSFHPLCAREARHRMEIWGKLGCEDVELRAFCAKHSEAQKDCSQREQNFPVTHDSYSTIEEHQPLSSIVNEPHKLKIARRNGDKFVLHTEPVDLEVDRLGGRVLSDDGSLDKGSNVKHQLENIDGQDSKSSNTVVTRNAEDAKVSDSSNFTLVLKKLIEGGKVNLNDVASEIGVSPNSLASDIAEDCLPPDLHGKIVKWLKNHAHIGTLQKTLKLKVLPTCISKAEKESYVEHGIRAPEKNVVNTPAKSTPPRRRTKGNIRVVKDNNLILTFKRSHGDDGVVLDADKNCQVVHEGLYNRSEESSPDAKEKASAGACDSEPSDILAGSTTDHKGDPTKCSSPSHYGTCQADEPVVSNYDTMVESNLGSCYHSFAAGEGAEAIRAEALPGSYVHPLILHKFSTRQNEVSYEIKADEDDESSCEVIQGLRKAKRMGILDMSPVDEVEGELVYYQHKLLHTAVARKHFSDGLISKVVKCLPQEINTLRKQNWDAVLVNRYLCELREVKKQGRKERRHKEAQAVLAAATAAAAASSRLSSFRKDSLDESAHRESMLKIKAFGGRSIFHAQQMPRPRETLLKVAGAWASPDPVPSTLESKVHSRVCDICGRSETLLNPVVVCSSCKVAVHIDCYRSVKDTTGPWYCELCEDLSSSRSRGIPAPNHPENPCLAECSLCGGTAGAFRKSTDGQWVHAFCAEWVLESTFRRGQVNPVEGMETISRGSDSCLICGHRQGVCIKCNYGHCQSTFHPPCGRSAGFYMNVRTSGGKIQHKAYCEKHSLVERTKAETQKHGVEEWNSLKKVRVELERLRLICERIIKREKLKRELVLCSHGILGWNRESTRGAFSGFLSPDVSSESATTSLRGYVNSYNKSCSETIQQRSDDITIDSSTVASKRRRMRPAIENDQKTDDSSTSQIFTQIPALVRASVSGKQIPLHRPSSAASASRSTSDDGGDKCFRHGKHSETFEKEVVMTSDQACMRNQRLPKGFVYVPIRRLRDDKESIAAAAASSDE